MKNNEIAFEGYQKQAVEDILKRSISMDVFRKAKTVADKVPASTMQRRIELIASHTW